jgi:hypothetical protein
MILVASPPPSTWSLPGPWHDSQVGDTGMVRVVRRDCAFRVVTAETDVCADAGVRFGRLGWGLSQGLGRDYKNKNPEASRSHNGWHPHARRPIRADYTPGRPEIDHGTADTFHAKFNSGYFLGKRETMRQ